MPNEPKIIDLELSNLCNTDCTFCPREKITRLKGFMQGKTLQKVLKTLKKEHPYIINLSGMGECLLHPKLKSFVKEIKSKLHCIVGLTTNGLLLKKHDLLKAPLDFLTISYNGNKKVLSNIKALVAKRKRSKHKPAINVTTLSHTSKEQLHSFWKKIGIDGVVKQKLHNRGGHLKIKNRRVFKSPCQIFKNSLFITWQGKALSCCHDIEEKNILGDLTKQPLQKVLTKRKKYLKQITPFKLCNNCNDALRGQYFSKDRYISCKK